MMRKEKMNLKQTLMKEFETKELEMSKYFLGIEVAYPSKGTFISQQKHVTIETGKTGCKPVSSPMDLNHKLSEAKESLLWTKERINDWLTSLYILLALDLT